MANIIYIIIINPASTHEINGTMPTPLDIINATTLANDHKYDLRILIVDEALNYALRLAKGETSVISPSISKDAVYIQSYPDNVDVASVPAWEISDTIKSITSPVIYVGYKNSSSYDIMNLINSYVIDNRWFIPTTEKVTIYQIMTDYINKHDNVYLLPHKTYDLYGGGKLDEMYHEKDMLDVKQQIWLGCLILNQYLDAGYDKGKNDRDVMGWCLNTETPIIKGLIQTYGLISPVPDRTSHMEIRLNSGYRRQLTEILGKVLSNFAINNDIITIQEVAQLGGWYDQRVYTVIISRLSDSIFNTHVYKFSNVLAEVSVLIDVTTGYSFKPPITSVSVISDTSKSSKTSILSNVSCIPKSSISSDVSTIPSTTPSISFNVPSISSTVSKSSTSTISTPLKSSTPSNIPTSSLSINRPSLLMPTFSSSVSTIPTPLKSSIPSNIPPSSPFINRPSLSVPTFSSSVSTIPTPFKSSIPSNIPTSTTINRPSLLIPTLSSSKK